MFFYTWFALLCGIFYVNAAPAPSPSAAAFDPGSLLGLNLVTHINATLTLDSLVTNLIDINFDVNNPLLIPLVIDQIKSSASLNGTTYATFTHTFKPAFVINPFQTVNSGDIPNVNLTQGAIASLDIIPAGILDIDSDIILQVLLPIPILGLKQSSVPTTYNLDLS